jgi:hypothetical protein
VQAIHPATIAPLLAFSLACGTDPALAPNSPVAPPNAPLRVETFVSPAGWFQVDLPAGITPELGRSGDEELVQYDVIARTATAKYQVTYSDLERLTPDKHDEFLDGLVKVIVDSGPSWVKGQRTTQVDGRSVRELQIEKDGIHEHWRYLNEGQRAFQLGLISNVSDPPAAQRFFDSFRLERASRSVHSIPQSGIELTLPSRYWALVSNGSDDDGHWTTAFTRGSAPGPVIVVHSEPVPRGLDVMKFSFGRRGQDRYQTDAVRCARPVGTSGERCVFIREDGVMALRNAVGGFFHHEVDGRRFDAYVVHAVYFDRGITVVLQAPTEEFLAVEAEFRQVLASLHAHPAD